MEWNAVRPPCIFSVPPVRIDMPFNQASNYNYLIAVNDYPELESPRAWYYFIESVEYINAHTTQLTLMLDVWQKFPV